MWVHDDIAATRGLVLGPEYLRRWVCPWYERIFSAIQAQGRKVVHVSDGNYLEALPDLMRARWLFCRVDAMERKIPEDQKLDYWEGE